MSENSKFFYIYKSEFHFVKMAIKATNKSATTHNKILMSSVSSALSVILTELCKMNNIIIILNNLKNFYKRKYLICFMV